MTNIVHNDLLQLLLAAAYNYSTDRFASLVVADWLEEHGFDSSQIRKDFHQPDASHDFGIWHCDFVRGRMLSTLKLYVCPYCGRDGGSSGCHIWTDVYFVGSNWVVNPANFTNQNTGHQCFRLPEDLDIIPDGFNKCIDVARGIYF